MSFTYDDNGLRTSKTVNGITTEYYWNGNLLVAEQTPYSLTVYNYDATGRPIGMSYRENTYGQYQWDVYWFDLNLQGDIVAVYNKTGVKLVSYSYDPWGKCTVNYSNGGASTSATKNNLRYRGYYLDSDLGLYYLQSRYYDPNTYRFINADGYLSTGQGILGYNMYAYCNNNPVNYVDYYGNWCAKICFDWSYSSDTERVIGGSGGGGIAIGIGISLLVDHLTKTKVSMPVKPINKILQKDAAREEEIAVTNESRRGNIYYHATSLENAQHIIETGIMVGSDWEGGLVFAWKSIPSKKALELSGARSMEVIIAFETSASFCPDFGITNPDLLKYGPVYSSGPIQVYNIVIVLGGAK